MKSAENTKTSTQVCKLHREFSRRDYMKLKTRRKISQERSHSFGLALSRPNSDVKAHKYFTFVKVDFLQQEKLFLVSLLQESEKRFNC